MVGVIWGGILLVSLSRSTPLRQVYALPDVEYSHCLHKVLTMAAAGIFSLGTMMYLPLLRDVRMSAAGVPVRPGGCHGPVERTAACPAANAHAPTLPPLPVPQPSGIGGVVESMDAGWLVLTGGLTDVVVSATVPWCSHMVDDLELEKYTRLERLRLCGEGVLAQ